MTRHPIDLDQQLRDGAAARRTLLADQPYPVGDYPARPRVTRHAGGGPSLAQRLAWLIGVGTVTTAGVLLSITAISPPSQQGPHLAALLDEAKPLRDAWIKATSEPSQMLKLTASEMALRATLDSVNALPERVAGLTTVVVDSERRMSQPIEQEWRAVGEDLRSAAAYVRRQWGIETDRPTDGDPASSRPAVDALAAG